MTIKSSRIGLVAIFAAASALAISPAWADGGFHFSGHGGRLGSRILKTVIPHIRASRGSALRSPLLRGRIPGLSSRNSSRFGNLQSWGQLRGLLRGSGVFGNRHHSAYSRYPYFGDRYGSSDREDAKAYRDVGIANAVVGLVSVLANSPLYNSAPTYVSSEPAYVTCPPPAVRYIRQPVLVRQGYYQETRVWVQDSYDPSTGVETGHYEIQRRWIPPVYELRDVQVR